jgi:hypothetical protein
MMLNLIKDSILSLMAYLSSRYALPVIAYALSWYLLSIEAITPDNLLYVSCVGLIVLSLISIMLCLLSYCLTKKIPLYNVVAIIGMVIACYLGYILLHDFYHLLPTSWHVDMVSIRTAGIMCLMVCPFIMCVQLTTRIFLDLYRRMD